MQYYQPLTISNIAGYFLTMRWVASPPVSRMRFGCQFSALIACSMHHQKSSSDSELHANILRPACCDQVLMFVYVIQWDKVIHLKVAGCVYQDVTTNSFPYTFLGESSSHLVLRGEYVAGSPPHAGAQGRQRLYQHLKKRLASLSAPDQQDSVSISTW